MADAGRQPIGVFDSGLGGLTVVRALTERLPSEKILYLGDTARVPYGSKSGETVVRYSRMSAHFLMGRDIKILMVACNTASAYALDALAADLAIPVLGAVEPGADEAVAATVRGEVGVIGTLGTVRSGSYPRAIAARDPRIRVAQLACPLLVPLVEEGWLGGAGDRLEDRAAAAIAERYLGELCAAAPNLDVLVLGCTHYPLVRALLARTAERLWDRPIALVDSAQAMARAADRILSQAGLLAGGAGGLSCFVTDDARFAEVAARFLGHPIATVEKVDL
ncbi:MAG: glutamate racemase [Myxococcales bacterium]|nr:glutamate racemase [Myxococcales bacterium]